MHERLNIPLQPTPTRRVDRRVVWMLGYGLIVAMVASLAFRLWITRDLTSAWHPEGTQTVRILKTAKTTKLLHEHFGSQTVIPGAPWSVSDLLAMSQREFSVHFDESGIVGFTVDRDDLDDQQLTADSFGLGNGTASGRTYIGRDVPSGQPKYTFGLSLWSDGTIFAADQTKIANIHINSSGLTIKGLGITAGPAPISVGTQILAKISLPPGLTQIPEIVETELGIAGQAKLLSEINRVGAAITIGSDDNRPTVIFIPTQDFSIDELAVIGKSMISRQNLTTLELTNADGSSVLELFSDSSRISSQITTNQEATIIKITDPNSQGFTIIKNYEGIYLSNQAEFEIIVSEPLISSCLRSANSFLRPKEMFSGLNTPLRNINEIAWNQSTTKLCW